MINHQSMREHYARTAQDEQSLVQIFLIKTLTE